MRVVEVISGLGLGGAERALAERLIYAPNDIDTHVIATSSATSQLAEEVGSRATLHRKPRNVIRTIHTLKPDVVVSHNPREAVRLLWSKSFCRRYPVVVIAHNTITSEYRMKSWLLDALLPLLNPRATKHIAVSELAADGPQCRGGRLIRVHRLGATIDSRCTPDARLWPPDTQHRLLALGRFSPQKNFSSLLQAVYRERRLMRVSETHLVMVGDGSLRSHIEQFISHHDLSDLITISRWIEPADSIMAAADALVISSVNEGGPLTLYEALLSGTRVISTPVGAASELLVSDPFLRVLSGTEVVEIQEGLKTVAHWPQVTLQERIQRQHRFAHLHTSRTATDFYQEILTLA